MFLLYMKRIIKSPVFIVSVVILTVLFVLGCEDLSYARDAQMSFLYLYSEPTTTGIAHVLVPAIVPMSFLLCFVDDLENRAFYYTMSRCSKISYFGGQIMAAITSSALVVVLSLVIFTVICFAKGAVWSTYGSVLYSFENTLFYPLLQDGFEVDLYVIVCIVFVLYSIPWAVAGMAVSLFAKNKYVILATPFLFVEILVYSQFFVIELAYLDPGYTLLLSVFGNTIPGVTYCFGYNVLLTIVLSFIYYIGSKRRFKSGKI